MTEIDLIQAHASSVNLAYVASQWWIAVSTALVVAVYFAAKHIPSWLFAMIIALYLLTSLSAIWEIMSYSTMAEQYYLGLIAFRAAKHIPQIVMPTPLSLMPLNGLINYAVFIFGTLSATAYAFVTWRAERKV